MKKEKLTLKQKEVIIFTLGELKQFLRTPSRNIIISGVSFLSYPEENVQEKVDTIQEISNNLCL